MQLDQLQPLEDNAKIHDEDQIQAITESFKRWGYVPTILIKKDKTIVGGHGTWTAAKAYFGPTTKLPVLQLEKELSELETQALALALNQLQMRTGFDSQKVTKTLEKLKELNFPLEVIGFTLPELETYLPDLKPLTNSDERQSDERPGYVGIKQVMLHYEGQDFVDFSEMARLLAKKFEVNTVSEVVLQCLKRVHLDESKKSAEKRKIPTKKMAAEARA